MIETMPKDLMEDYREGRLTGKQVAEKLGVSVPTVHCILKRSNYVFRRRGAHKRFVITEQHVQDYLDGKKDVKDIANELGCSIATAYCGLRNNPYYRARQGYSPKRSIRTKALLEKKQQEIAKQFFAGRTLAEIGAEKGFSRERARQYLTPIREKMGLKFTERILACAVCQRDLLVCGAGSRHVECPDCFGKRKG